MQDPVQPGTHQKNCWLVAYRVGGYVVVWVDGFAGFRLSGQVMDWYRICGFVVSGG